ncbi:hypothetical protein [Psychrobacter sp. 16-MNA-CIBAN-0192]|uniref:hypothetical protein n=1 Tax=Psychrobacter sp. 16-MNA-CIBAN-0192 TaxID=3140448 RepID=UPI00332DE7E7
MAKVLQRLDILLFANTAQYRSEMRDTQQSTSTLFGAMKADAMELGKVGAAALAGMAAAGTAAIGVMIKEQIEMTNELVKTARIATTSVETMQKLTIAAKSLGVEQDKLGDIYKDVQDKIGDFLSTGGGEMMDFFENMPPELNMTADAFRQLSGPDALQKYYDGLQSANLSQSEMIFYMESVADEASLLMPLLHNGGEGFDIWAKAAENAGAIMDEKTIRATKELTAANAIMMLSVDGAKTQFTSAFIPVLSDVAAHLVGTGSAADIARRSGESLVVVFKTIAATGVGVVTIVKVIGKALGGLGAAIAQLGNGVDWDSPFAFFQLGRNFIDNNRAAAAVFSDVGQDIMSTISQANKQMDTIYALGTNGTNQTVSAVVKYQEQQAELNRILGKTGAQIQENKKAAEEAAKAGEKAAAKEAKAKGDAAKAQARLVGITGDSGIGKAHVDFRYARGSALFGKEISSAHLARFQADGKAVTSYPMTSGFGPRNIKTKGASKYHLGVDYGTPLNTKITTKVPVKDVKARFDSGGGGYVTDVTFEDGVKVSILHQMPASKNIKGGSSGTSNPYNAANSQAEQLLNQQANEEKQLLKKQASEDARDAAELTRLLEQQAQQRATIRMEYADEVVRIDMQLADKIAKIDASGFSKEERDAFVIDAQQRAATEVANYEDAQAKKLAAFSSFKQSERDIVTQNAINSATAVVRDQELTAEARTEALDSIKQKEVYELNLLDQKHAQEMQSANQYQQTEEERIKAQYELERREIILTINMDEELRQAKMDNLDAAERLALDELRYSYEREIRELVNVGQTELQVLRDSYAQQRAELDRRTDISAAQKSDLRNAMAGAQVYDTNQMQKGARDGYNAQQSDMNGTGANYGLAQQYQARLDVIKAALDAEVIAEEEAAQAKMQARQEFESAATQLTLASAESTAASLAGSFATMLGEQNAFYKLAFGAQQVFVVASAGLNMYEAWGDMMAQGATLSQKIAGAAVIAAQFGRIISAASAIKLSLPKVQGQAHNGLDYVPREGTYLLDEGERVVKPKDNRKLSDFLDNADGYQGKASAPIVNMVIENHAGVPVSQRVDDDGRIRVIVGEELNKQLPNQVNEPYSGFRRALENNYQMHRKLG